MAVYASCSQPTAQLYPTAPGIDLCSTPYLTHTAQEQRMDAAGFSNLPSDGEEDEWENEWKEGCRQSHGSSRRLRKFFKDKRKQAVKDKRGQAQKPRDGTQDAVTAQAEQLSKELDTVRHEHNVLCGDLRKTCAERNALRTHLDETLAEIEQLSAEIEYFRGLQNARRAGRDAITSERDAMRDECNALRLRQPLLSSKLQQVRDERDGLSRELEQRCAHCDTLRRTLAAAKKSESFSRT